MDEPKMNFSGVTALLVEGDRHATSILAEVLRRFGLERQIARDTGAEAKDFLQRSSADLCFCEATLPDMSGLDFVRWLRRQSSSVCRYIPIMVLSGYTDLNAVSLARDAGANFVVRKPLSPQVLYDRLAWASQGTRKFVETAAYVGPDRRFRSIGPPEGVGRRATDLSAEVGEATEPNMTQEEIDALMKPSKVLTL